MFLDIDNNRVFALDFGSGPRTLLAHSGWIGNFEDWILTLAPLSRTWRTVVYDHRGAGETRVPPERISDEALIDDVFRVMDALKIDKCVLGGFSRGSITALRAALKRPDRFDGLILLNGHAGVTLPGETVAPRPPPSKWPGKTHADRLRWFIEQCTPEPGIDHIRPWGVNILSRSTEAVAERLGTLVPEETIDWASRLPQLDLPTLLIHGEKDPFCRIDVMRFIEARIPRSRLVVLEGAGHLPAMIQPDRVAHEIDQYFSGSST